MARPMHPKEPFRYEPADSVPVASHVEARDQLSIDEHIRMVIRSMQTPAERPRPLTPAELRQLEEELPAEEPLSEFQAQVLEEDVPPELDPEGFLGTLTPAEREAFRQALSDQAGGEAPEATPPSSPAEPLPDTPSGP